MKKIKSILLAGFALTALAGCKDEEVKIEIAEFPKTTFYCGEEFSSTGIVLNVTLPNGTSFLAEDIATSKPSTQIPGTQTVKVYYTNDEYDIDEFVTYDINIIDWTPEEKAVFSQTSFASLVNVYYPKMEGMKVLTETDDATGEVIDYWIEKENSSMKEIDDYSELLNNFKVTKTVSDSSGTYELDFKFYEQSVVPSDYRDYYDEHDLICYKCCASYKYLDYSSFQEYELYGNEIEDTLVIGLNEDGDMIIRFIANSIFFETMFSCEVNEHLDFSGLYSGAVIPFLQQTLMGYVDEEGTRHLGYIENIAPFAKDYIILPDYEPDVVSVANYASMYPWLHGEDDLSFELEISSNDTEAYDDFVASIEAIPDFVKTTRTDKIDRKDVEVSIYKMENKAYVGDLTIEVTDFMEDATSYTQTSDSGTIKQTVTVGAYRVYYRWSAPQIISPAQEELYKIYDKYYGVGKYDPNHLDVYPEGSVGTMLYFYTETDNVKSREETMDKFVADYLEGYTVTEPASSKTISGYDLYTAKYTNGTFDIEVFTYYSGTSGKYTVEFIIDLAAQEE